MPAVARKMLHDYFWKELVPDKFPRMKNRLQSAIKATMSNAGGRGQMLRLELLAMEGSVTRSGSGRRFVAVSHGTFGGLRKELQGPFDTLMGELSQKGGELAGERGVEFSHAFKPGNREAVFRFKKKE